MSRSVGFRIFPEPKRPSKELMELFRGLPVANIADNMGRLYCVDTAIRNLNGRMMLGPAFTVKACPGDNLMIHKAMQLAKPGDVIMVDGNGYMERSLAGDIMMTNAVKLGFGGFVFDGAIRDIDGIEKLSVPVYARGVQPRGPYKNGPGEINVPVCIGGQVVMPGDIVVGDLDGIVVIRPNDAEEVAALAKAQFKKEEQAMKDIAAGTFDVAWIDKALNEKGAKEAKDY